MRTLFHMHMTRARLIEEIVRYGYHAIEGASDTEDAIEKVIADGRKNFTVGDCDNPTDEGTCGGHPMLDEEQPRLAKAKAP